MSRSTSSLTWKPANRLSPTSSNAGPAASHTGQASQLGSPGPGQLQRPEWLQYGTPAGRAPPRTLGNETDDAVVLREAFQELAGIQIGALMQYETALKLDSLPFAHYVSNPRFRSSRSLSAQCSRTLTQSSR